MAKPTTPTRKALGDAGPTIDILSYYYLLREKWWVFALCLAVTCGAAAAYILRTQPVYASTAVVQVEQKSANVVTFKDVLPEEYKNIEDIKTVEGALSSDSLMHRVLKKNQLVETPEFQAPKGQPAYTESQLIDIMQAKASVKLRRGTRLIDITVEDPSPERAAKLAGSVVVEYIRSDVEQKSKVAGFSSEVLLKQAEELKQKLHKSETKLQDYREQQGTVSLEEKQNILSDKLKELNKQIQEAKGNRIKLESDLPMLKRAATMPIDELFSVESIGKSPELLDQQKLLNLKDGEFAQIKKRYLELHPKYMQAENEVKELRKSMEETGRKVAARLINTFESSRETENKLVEALQEQEKMGLELSRVAIPYGALQREAAADRALFESVLARVKETKVTEEIEKSNIRVISEPVPSKWPSKPLKTRTLAAAIAAGIVLGFIVLLLIQAFDTSLRSVDQAEKTLELAALAAVPEAKGKVRRSPLVLVDHPAGREAESFRCLRTSLSLRPGGAPRSVLFTSAVPAEGKSYCSANYAVSLAQQGLKTLLIDADLRRPGLGNIFPKLKDAKGLSEILNGTGKLDDSCHDTGIEKLSLMPAGSKIGSPAELLGSAAFRELLDAALAKYDRVVLDTAPINAVSDTLLLGKAVDAVAFVVRSRKTPARAINRALHLLEKAEALPAGFILNRLPSRLANYYYYDEGSYSSAGVYGT